MRFLGLAALAATTCISARPWGWVETQDTDDSTTMFIPTETFALNLEYSSGDGPTRPYFKPSTESAYYDQNDLAEAENVESVVKDLVVNSLTDKNIQVVPISENQENSNEENVETILSIPVVESSSKDVTRESETRDLMNEPAEAHAESSENGYRTRLDRLSGKEINTFVTIEETRVINVPGNSDVVDTKQELTLDYYRNLIAEDHLHIAAVFLTGLVFVTVGGVIFSRFRMQQDW